MNLEARAPTYLLLWPCDTATPEPTAEELRQRVEFWAKVAPPIYDVQVADDTLRQELNWD